MTPKTLKTAKISVKIWEPLIEKLDTKMEAACLRRDAYLTKLLEFELDRLEEEVSIPNSEAAYNFVSGRLRQLPSQARQLGASGGPDEAAQRDVPSEADRA